MIDFANHFDSFLTGMSILFVLIWAVIVFAAARNHEKEQKEIRRRFDMENKG
jgi:preprotein translocase subunit YajC